MVSNEKMMKLFEGEKFEELKKALEENLREEAQKKSGTKSSDTAILKRITKNATNYNKSFGMAHEFFYRGCSWYGFCEGHYILASTEGNFGYDTAKEGDNANYLAAVKNCISGADNETTEKLTIDIAELKTYLKLNKPNKYNDNCYVIDYNGKAVCFNQQMLSDAVDFTGSCELIFPAIHANSKCLKSPAYIVTENRIACVLPVNCTNPESAFARMENFRKQF